jgi:hypothetical protein
MRAYSVPLVCPEQPLTAGAFATTSSVSMVRLPNQTAISTVSSLVQRISGLIRRASVRERKCYLSADERAKERKKSQMQSSSRG